MNTLISLELRWFFPDSLPTQIVDWFHNDLPGSKVSPVDERNDTYLFQRNNDDIGIKLRDGRLEIKWRQLAVPYRGAHNVSGQMERWVKWMWKDQDGPGPSNMASLAVPDGPWVTVAKMRWQRKYRWVNATFAPAPPEDIVEPGASIEITTLEVSGTSRSTVLVETFGPDQRAQEDILNAAIKDLWSGFPVPTISGNCSYGYPHWLGVFLAGMCPT